GISDAEVLAVSQSTELAVLLRRDRVTNLGTLARVPLAGGTPREIAENVAAADWSPDGTNLAIIRQVGDKNRVEYPIGTVRYDTAHYMRDLRVSPDGQRLAIIEPSQGQYDLAIIDRGNPVTIAKGWGRGVTGMTWSRDGKEIYISGTPDSSPPALFAVNVETGATRLVSRLTGAIRMFDVSPKGEVLMSNGVWRAALVWKPGSGASADATLLTPEEPERDISWLDWSILADLSPNGRTILFSETREGGGPKYSVYLRHADTPTPVRLGDGMGDGLSPDGKWALVHQNGKLALIPTGTGEPRELKIAGAFDAGAAWLPDSRRAIVVAALDNSGYRLYLIDTLDETAKPVSPGNVWSAGARAFAVSPDGRIVAGMSAEESILLYAIDGSGGAPLAGAEKGEIPMQWSADGTSLFVYTPTALPARITRITVATGARELWKEFTPSDPAGVTRIAPVIVTPDANAYAYNAIRALSDLYVVEGMK
ncbi:MAG TPA: WD40 repeat domain-containing protein, partial [Thermoanaerobaculia bacterium]|nr:WD40 repeat domain-containing protein [Thermoanaerobaculia bacterium]